jgi:hypothetical protein
MRVGAEEQMRVRGVESDVRLERVLDLVQGVDPRFFGPQKGLVVTDLAAKQRSHGPSLLGVNTSDFRCESNWPFLVLHS